MYFPQIVREQVVGFDAGKQVFDCSGGLRFRNRNEIVAGPLPQYELIDVPLQVVRPIVASRVEYPDVRRARRLDGPHSGQQFGATVEKIDRRPDRLAVNLPVFHVGRPNLDGIGSQDGVAPNLNAFGRQITNHVGDCAVCCGTKPIYILLFVNIDVAKGIYVLDQLNLNPVKARGTCRTNARFNLVENLLSQDSCRREPEIRLVRHDHGNPCDSWQLAINPVQAVERLGYTESCFFTPFRLLVNTAVRYNDDEFFVAAGLCCLSKNR